MQSFKLQLKLKPGANPGEVFKYFKQLETYVHEHFIDVEDFHCEKPYFDDVVLMEFSHNGRKNPSEKLVMPKC